MYTTWLTKDKQQALKGLKNDKDTVTLPSEKECTTVVMDKTDYNKMDALVNDKQTTKYLLEIQHRHFNENSARQYFPQSNGPTLLTIRNYTLDWNVPCHIHRACTGYRNYTNLIPTYELSKYLTTMLKPLTYEFKHKLQSTENFINAIRTIQTPDDNWCLFMWNHCLPLLLLLNFIWVSKCYSLTQVSC